MENADFPPLINICRFCLSEDEDCVIPLEDLLECNITIEDLVRFSGVEVRAPPAEGYHKHMINVENKASYAVCMECTSKLKASATFKAMCLEKDPMFRDMYALLVKSIKEASQKVIDHIELSDSEDETGTQPVVIYVNDPLWKPTKQLAAQAKPPKAPKAQKRKTKKTDDPVEEKITKISNDDEDSQYSQAFSCTTDDYVIDDELFAYSANYIVPGEILYDQHELQPMFFVWGDSLNPPAPDYGYIPYNRGNAKRKLPLCEKCGLIVYHLKSHNEIHYPGPLYSCPHCPVKMKQKSNLVMHIQQVHLRKPSKKCDICGQQFIHHKTYRYHMLTHESEGKTFECADCEKSFPNAIYLRDHYNRLHNAARNKPIKTPSNGAEKVKRKRNRSVIIPE